MNIGIWEQCTFDFEIFRCRKMYCSASIIITISARTLIPSYQFENMYPAYFSTEIS
jgi:hypothetical protein